MKHKVLLVSPDQLPKALYRTWAVPRSSLDITYFDDAPSADRAMLKFLKDHPVGWTACVEPVFTSSKERLLYDLNKTGLAAQNLSLSLEALLVPGGTSVSLSFEAAQKLVNNATEINNKLFQIERSINNCWKTKG